VLIYRDFFARLKRSKTRQWNVGGTNSAFT
jgi:hypothetical protein